MTAFVVFIARWSWIVVMVMTVVIGGYMLRTVTRFDDSTELAGEVAEMRTFQEEMFQLMISSSLLGEVGEDSLHAVADRAEAHATGLLVRIENSSDRQNMSEAAAAEVSSALQAVVRNLHAIAGLEIGPPDADGGSPEASQLGAVLAEATGLSGEGLDGFALNILLGAVGYASLSANVTADLDQALEVLGRQNRSAVAELKEVGRYGIAFLLIAGVASSGAFAWAGRRARRLEWDAERAHELDGLKGEFVGLASHELRTPLTGILGYSELALEDDTLSDQTRGWLEHVHGESMHLAQIVGELLDLSRIEAGRMELTTERLQLGTVLATVSDRFESASSTHPPSVEGDFGAVDGDGGKLLEVFSNLVDNAIKYSPDGGRVRIVGTTNDDVVRVSVSDSGMGIPRDQLDRVFDRFHRVQRPNTEHIRSTGLGLYLVRELVTLMDGEVAITSQFGTGTTVTVVLPLASDGAASTEDQAA